MAKQKSKQRKTARAPGGKSTTKKLPAGKSPNESRIRKTAKPRDSKQAKLIALLERPEGATIDDLMKATGWQAHSVRGVMSGALKKRLGLTITSEKGENGRTYRVAARAA